MDRSRSYFRDGEVESVMIMLQALSLKDGFKRFVTKKYITEKLTELNLTEYLEDIFSTYYVK